MTGVIAVRNGTNAENDVCGLIVYWKLSANGMITHAGIAQSWIPQLPDTMKPKRAEPRAILLRAMRQFHTYDVRPLRATDGEAAYCLVHEQYEEGEPVHSVGMKAKLVTNPNDPTGYSPVATNSESFPESTLLEGYYKSESAKLNTTDLSGWLVHCVQLMQAVSLRDTGGFYFLPRSKRAMWNALRQVIDTASQDDAVTLFEIPALTSDEAAKAAMEGLTAESEKQIENINKLFTEYDSISAVQCNYRLKTIRDVESKITEYESVLGLSLEKLREKLEVLRAQLLASVMM